MTRLTSLAGKVSMICTFFYITALLSAFALGTVKFVLPTSILQLARGFLRSPLNLRRSYVKVKTPIFECEF
ncbi:hypothetical protein [Scytonema sp. NUACC26]|uniref:hypothetical protein n=1 Tax=Scytonema sp. NUACC26 TaxID=3140176 RepID=UPI0038B2407E